MNKEMYQIEKMTFRTPEGVDVLDSLHKIIHKYYFDYMQIGEAGELMEKEEAEEKFEGEVSYVEKIDDGMYEVTIVYLEHGEPVIDKYLSEEEGEDVYMLEGYYLDKAAPFDDESRTLLEDLGIDPEIRFDVEEDEEIDWGEDVGGEIL